MVLDRRRVMVAGLGIGAGAAAGPRRATAQISGHAASGLSVTGFGARAGSADDQTRVLQSAIDAAVESGAPLHVPAGIYRAAGLVLRSGLVLTGVPGHSVLRLVGDGNLLEILSAEAIRLSGLVLDGSEAAPSGDTPTALLSAERVGELIITGCKMTNSPGNGLSFAECAGHISDNAVIEAAQTGIFCTDSAGLDVSHNHVRDCGNNGIQVWRSEEGEDGTIVAHNRVERIRDDDGGSGQNGNGINVFRADSVLVTGNRIADCAFSAIRANAASNCQITGNACSRSGEVAVYVEFGFEGALIAQNVIDKAATGVSVTNFNRGGRMAVVQGNLVRDLTLRDGERGVGIHVEADSVVNANLIEDAPGAGIQVGWGRFLRDVTVNANLIRKARIGIAISAVDEAGYAFVTDNMILETEEGAIRAMDHEQALGHDLSRSSAESYPNMAVFGNVSR